MDFSQVRKVVIPESDYYMGLLRAKGATEQSTYNGDNTIGLSDVAETTAHGVTYSISNGVLSVDGTGDGTLISIPITLYNLSRFSQGDHPAITVFAESGEWTNGAIGVRFFVGGTRILLQQQRYDGLYYKSNAFTGDPSEVTVANIFIGSTFSGTDFKCRLMLTKTETQPAVFEPYVGGIPAPNPDYPQQIQTVTGQQTITINGDNYQLNFGSIELCKIGSYQDKIYYDNGKWWLRKEIGKVLLNGSESGWASNAPVYYLPKTAFTGLSFPQYTTQMLSDYFNAKSSWDSLKIGSFYSGATAINFNYDGTGSNLASFKTWLGNNNVSVYAPLETPAVTEITEQNLLSDLNVLLALGRFSQATPPVITVSSVSQNLAAIISVEDLLNDVAKIEQGGVTLWEKS